MPFLILIEETRPLLDISFYQSQSGEDDLFTSFLSTKKVKIRPVTFSNEGLTRHIVFEWVNKETFNQFFQEITTKDSFKHREEYNQKNNIVRTVKYEEE
jgi:hypothetical protein